jgi:hypothetical protein
LVWKRCLAYSHRKVLQGSHTFIIFFIDQKEGEGLALVGVAVAELTKKTFLFTLASSADICSTF